eukprot:3523382-Rhodomonas_salina.1
MPGTDIRHMVVREGRGTDMQDVVVPEVVASRQTLYELNSPAPSFRYTQSIPVQPPASGTNNHSSFRYRAGTEKAVRRELERLQAEATDAAERYYRVQEEEERAAQRTRAAEHKASLKEELLHSLAHALAHKEDLLHA